MSNTNLQNIAQRHRDMLAESGISPGFAADTGVRTVTERSELPEGLDWCPLPGLLFPLRDVSGETVYQYRPDNPEPNQDGQVAKYVFAKGSGSHLTVHPQVADRIAADNTKRVLIVEGTKQTICASEHAADDTAVVGIQGCYGWSSNGSAVPEMSDIGYAGREVVIAFDGDRNDKEGVYEASVRLRDHLKATGAKKVAFLSLPAGGSMGLDDYLGQSVKADDRPATLARLVDAAKTSVGRRPPRKKKAAPVQVRGAAVVDEKAGTIHTPDRTDPTSNVTIPGETLVGCTARITETLSIVDHEGRPLTANHTLEVTIGGRAYQVGDVDDDQLENLGKWLKRVPSGLGTRIHRASSPSGRAEAANAIRSHRTDEISLVTVWPRTGWAALDDGFGWLTPAGAVTENGIDQAHRYRGSGSLGRIEIPDPSTNDPEEVADAWRWLLQTVPGLLVDPTPWWALLGLTGWSLAGGTGQAGLAIIGSGGSGKSVIQQTAAAMFGPQFSRHAPAASMEGTANGVIGVGKDAHNMLVNVDDARPRSSRKEQEAQDGALQALLRRSGMMIHQQRQRVDQRSGQVVNAEQDQTAPYYSVTAESLPSSNESTSTDERILTIQVSGDTTWNKDKDGAADSAEAAAARGVPALATSSFIANLHRWIAGASPSVAPARAVDTFAGMMAEERQRYASEVIPKRLPDASPRVREVTAPIAVGLDMLVESAYDAGAISFDDYEELTGQAIGCVIDAARLHSDEMKSGDASGSGALDRIRAVIASRRAVIASSNGSIPGSVSPSVPVIGGVTNTNGTKAVALLPEQTAQVLGIGKATLRGFLSKLTIPDAAGAPTRSARVCGHLYSRCLVVPQAHWGDPDAEFWSDGAQSADDGRSDGPMSAGF